MISHNRNKKKKTHYIINKPFKELEGFVEADLYAKSF